MAVGSWQLAKKSMPALTEASVAQGSERRATWNIKLDKV
jgi:hypothetical protein